MTKIDEPQKLSCIEKDLYEARRKQVIAENKLKQFLEVTDEDIIEWACYGYNESVGMDEITEGRIQGAKAMRNGEIKHKER